MSVVSPLPLPGRKVICSRARWFRGLAWAVMLTTFGELPAPCARAVPVEFGRDILPILSDNCFKCHGPDEEARKAKLRLDRKAEAFRDHDGVRVIVPGSSRESELIARIFSDDPDEVMPPPKSNRTLTSTQKDLLKQWIDQGAPWAEHWAFAAPDLQRVQAALGPTPGAQNP